MKTLLIVGLFFIAGCFNDVPNRTMNNTGLNKYHDVENDVTCYRVYGYDGISCVKVDKK